MLSTVSGEREPCAIGHSVSSCAKRPLTGSTGGRYSKQLSGKRRQLWKLMWMFFPPYEDVAVGCVDSGLNIGAYFIGFESFINFVILEVRNINSLLLCSGCCSCCAIVDFWRSVLQLCWYCGRGGEGCGRRGVASFACEPYGCIMCILQTESLSKYRHRVSHAALMLKPGGG